MLKTLAIVGYGLVGALMSARVAGVRRVPGSIWFARAAMCLPVFGAALVWHWVTTVDVVMLSMLGMGACAIVFLWRRLTPERSPRLIVLAMTLAVFVISLAYWHSDYLTPALHPIRMGLFVAIVCTVGMMSRGPAGPALAAPRYVAIAFGAVLTIDMARYAVDDGLLLVMAHHWSAYIGSAQYLLAGLVPFYDVPLQYGLGPTLFVAGACRVAGCWDGLHWLLVVTTLISASLLLRMMLTGAEARGRAWQWVAAGVGGAAIFLWPGFTPIGGGILATPSLSSVRFLPVIVVAFLVWTDRMRAARLAVLFAVWWAPEVGVMALIAFGLPATARFGFVRALVDMAALAVGAYVLLFLGIHVVYGRWPTLGSFFEYVTHVPGRADLSQPGACVLLAATLGLATWLLFERARDAADVRRDVAAAALLFATSLYYFGHSDANTVNCLMPFMVLVAFRAIARHDPARPGALAAILVVGLATISATLTLSRWDGVPLGAGVQVSMARPRSTLEALDVDWPVIRGTIVDADGLGIADLRHGWTAWRAVHPLWTPITPELLWGGLPDDRRRVYIVRSAVRLRRSGWAVVNADRPEWLDDLSIAYRITTSWTVLGVPDISGARAAYIVARMTPR